MSAAAAMREAAQLYSAGRLDEALQACQAILRTDPRHFYALHLASTIALEHGRLEESIAWATRALELAPGHAEVLANRGAALRRGNRIDEALADYDTALRAGAPSPTLLVNRGIALAALNRHAEAIAQYDRALALDANHAPAHFHRGLSRLVTGDLPRGFSDNEWRWKGSHTQGPARSLDAPRWTGTQDISGKTVLLHAEQGMGDTIQMARYAALLRERGARVVLEVHGPLVDLLASAGDGIVAMGSKSPPFDFHLPMMSAPLAFGTTLETIPASPRYLSASANAIAKWRMNDAAPRPRVGFAWSGSRTLTNDLNRSMPLATMRPLIERAATAVSLQKDVREGDAAALSASRMVPAAHALRDFADTAGLIENLDLVVTVDTAVAHLAGALGKPAWILLPFSPDWRWLLDRADSPWYPSARLFRQPGIGQWGPVIEEAAAALGDLK
jgi:hypothetical protein